MMQIADIIFYLTGLITLSSALMVILTKDIFRAALFLAATFLGVVALFILLFAEFLAAVQLIIYVGAISVVIIFAIMFLWQHPHFYAIAWMCKDDYARANFKMLPVIEPDGKRTIRQIFWHLTLLVPVSVLLYVEGSSGMIYVVGVIILTSLFLLSALPLAKGKSVEGAKLLLKSSVIYLPLLLILIIVDKIL